MNESPNLVQVLDVKRSVENGLDVTKKSLSVTLLVHVVNRFHLQTPPLLQSIQKVGYLPGVIQISLLSLNQS